MNSKIRRASLVVGLIVVVGISGSLAYFTDSDTKENQATIGHLDGTLIETSTQDNISITSDGIIYHDAIMPGDTISKEPAAYLKEDSVESYVRLKVDTVGIDSSLISFDIQNNWIQGSDGYYYYQEVLRPGHTTNPLFNHFNISLMANNDIVDKKVDIKVEAQFIQYHNISPIIFNGNIVGWPIDDKDVISY